MPILRSCFPTALIALAALLFATLPAKAQTVAVSFSSTAQPGEDYASDPYASPPEPGYNLGYEFAVNSPITVTSVGFFYDPTFWGDAPDQGFTQDHPVGIYEFTSSGLSLLDSGIVSEDTANDTLDGAFEYVSLAGGLDLSAGQDYVISGLTGPTDPFEDDVQSYGPPPDYTASPGFSTAPEISYVQGYASVTDQPTDTLDNDAPTPDSVNDPGYFGPNFEFTDNGVPGGPVVPESSSLTLIAPGLLVLLAAAALRRRSARARSQAR